ncbi:glycosyltransferase family 9 protein [Ferruginibacter lapsinanis]|uniref:glycosyltransferase family 9 protein n=1 Tax=Ferruginibacter lapsinanis TaxID=563172 RepID=UPI001E30C1D4|nr:glycosyltransferase family 9 protein [Ferruginibacter lapsinanis]UEG49826.1 glycosyltransferase family 9 protein [Ferruginibacter lapsinanis]
MNQAQNILIRLPNWLGDMVMASAFVKAVKEQYPNASIDLIAKKGIDFLLDHYPAHSQHFIFNKETYKGLGGARKFGKEIAAQKKYDLFFCLPDSFSSAVMAKASGAKKVVGYKKELRSFLLTHSYQKKKNIHRVEEYVDLLQQFTQINIHTPSVELNTILPERKNSVIVNINSEASSRRLPAEKAISLINSLRKSIEQEIILIGSPKEKEFVDSVYNALTDKLHITNNAGKTNLTELLILLGSSSIMLTTDSGPAHVANALGTHTIVLFGAGNENNTAPYNKINSSTIRLGQLPCETCLKNVCRKFPQPECLNRLSETMIVEKVKSVINNP